MPESGGGQKVIILDAKMLEVCVLPPAFSAAIIASKISHIRTNRGWLTLKGVVMRIING